MRVITQANPLSATGTLAYTPGLTTIYDASGYVRQGADADGAIVSAWLFDPDETALEGPNGPVSGESAQRIPLIYGEVYDWSTGLIYRGGRYFC
jgi:hypothetical protein